MWEPLSPSSPAARASQGDPDATQTDDDEQRQQQQPQEQEQEQKQRQQQVEVVAGGKGKGKGQGGRRLSATAATALESKRKGLKRDRSEEEEEQQQQQQKAAKGGREVTASKRGRQSRGKKKKGSSKEEGAEGEGTPTAADPGGGARKGKAKRGKGKATAAALALEHGLPGAFGRLYDVYDAVDTVVCFLLKSALAPSVASIKAMVKQIYGAAASSSALPPPVPSTQDLLLLCALAPQAMALHYVPVVDVATTITPHTTAAVGPNDNMGEEDGDGRFRLELAFPTFGGVGKGHAKKRRDAVRAALLSAAVRAHDAFLASSLASSPQAAEEIWDYGSQGWHPGFNPKRREEVEAVLTDPVGLPPRPATLAEAISTDPYKTAPAPLVPLGATGHYKQKMARQGRPTTNSTAANGEEEDGEGQNPFSESFFNNVPADQVPSSPGECVGLGGILPYLQRLPFYRDQVVYSKTFPGQAARFGQLDHPLAPTLQAALEAKGVTRLFEHQAKAINAALSGQHIAIATATASGKSLVYTTPVLQTILSNAAHGVPARALYLFPTKALAQDQLRSLRSLLATQPELAARVSVEAYDGDTPFADREAIRERAHILLSNPDMLHQSVCPQHRQWGGFLSALRYVVVDEAHMYTGVFGSHVALVLRRLLRLCLRYARGQQQQRASPSSQGLPDLPVVALPVPQFVLCSATVANPREHFATLLPLHDVLGGEGKLTVIDEDTSPRGQKTFVVWNPPLKELLSSSSSAAAAGRGGAEADRALENEGKNGGEEEEEEEGEEEEALAPLLMTATPQEGGVGKEEVEEGRGCVPSSAFLVGSGGGKGAGAEAGGMRLGTEGQQQQQQEPKQREEKATSPGVRMEEEEGEGGVVIDPEVLVPRRRSSIVETAMLFAALVKQRVRTLAFCKVRKLVEMVLRYTLQDLRATAPALAPMVRSYRGGYTKEDRRAIEAALFGNELLGVTATCALELGVDIGTLDCTLHLGFPGSIASLWQQAGRAGRGATNPPSLAILVCFDSPVDQHFASRPEELWALPPEKAVTDPGNPQVLRGQLLCAAGEAPLGGRYLPGCLDRAIFGNAAFDEAMAELVNGGHLVGPLGDGSYRKGEWVTHPERSVSIRMIDPITFEVVDASRNKVIDSVGYTRAFFELFEGAIYMHQARQYRVTKLDLLLNRAMVYPVRVAYYTASRNSVDVTLTKTLESSEDGTVASGCAQVVAKVWGYRKVWLQSHRVFETGLFSLPPMEYHTRGLFVHLPLGLQQEVEAAGLGYQAGIHAANHALVAVTPLFLRCDPGDIETEHTFPVQNRPRPPRVLVYDKRPGGIGAAESLFSCVEGVLSRALALVESCPCEHATGCPGCVGDFRCSGYNVALDKQAAILILRALLAARRRERKRLAVNAATETHAQVHETAEEVGEEEEEEEGEEEGLLTPRKATRRQALKLAKAMDGARARDVSLQRSWGESFPQYRPEADHD